MGQDVRSHSCAALFSLYAGWLQTRKVHWYSKKTYHDWYNAFTEQIFDSTAKKYLEEIGNNQQSHAIWRLIVWLFNLGGLNTKKRLFAVWFVFKGGHQKIESSKQALAKTVVTSVNPSWMLLCQNKPSKESKMPNTAASDVLRNGKFKQYLKKTAVLAVLIVDAFLEHWRDLSRSPKGSKNTRLQSLDAILTPLQKRGETLPGEINQVVEKLRAEEKKVQAAGCSALVVKKRTLSAVEKEEAVRWADKIFAYKNRNLHEQKTPINESTPERVVVRKQADVLEARSELKQTVTGIKACSMRSKSEIKSSIAIQQARRLLAALANRRMVSRYAHKRIKTSLQEVAEATHMLELFKEVCAGAGVAWNTPTAWQQMHQTLQYLTQKLSNDTTSRPSRVRYIDHVILECLTSSLEFWLKYRSDLIRAQQAAESEPPCVAKRNVSKGTRYEKLKIFYAQAIQKAFQKELEQCAWLLGVLGLPLNKSFTERILNGLMGRQGRIILSSSSLKKRVQEFQSGNRSFLNVENVCQQLPWTDPAWCWLLRYSDCYAKKDAFVTHWERGEKEAKDSKSRSALVVSRNAFLNEDKDCENDYLNNEGNTGFESLMFRIGYLGASLDNIEFPRQECIARYADTPFDTVWNDLSLFQSLRRILRQEILKIHPDKQNESEMRTSIQLKDNEYLDRDKLKATAQRCWDSPDTRSLLVANASSQRRKANAHVFLLYGARSRSYEENAIRLKEAAKAAEEAKCEEKERRILAEKAAREEKKARLKAEEKLKKLQKRVTALEKEFEASKTPAQTIPPVMQLQRKGCTAVRRVELEQKSRSASSPYVRYRRQG